MIGLYEGAKTGIRVDSELSEESEDKVGMHQESVLSHFSAIVVDVVTAFVRSGLLSDLLYADDIVPMSEIIEGLRSKFLEWKENLERKGFKDNLGKTKVMVSNGITQDGMSKSKVDPCWVCSLIEHLSTLEDNLSHYFPLINTAQYDWIRNPSVKTAIYSSLTLTEELSAVSTGRGLMIKYKELSLETFWIISKERHASLSKKRRLFYCNCPPHIYVNWDFQASPQLSVKREELFNEEMRVCLIDIRPNIEEIARSHQVHVSH